MCRRAFFMCLSRKSSLLAIASVLGLFLGLALPVSVAAETIHAGHTVTATNQHRSQSSLSSLVIDERLTESARSKAEHMLTHDYWAHNAPDGSTPWTFIRQAGFDYEAAGENLARGFSDTDSMVAAWMNSPMHRANILNQSFTHVGIATAQGVLDGVETTVVVAHYGALSQESLQAVRGASVQAATRHIQAVENMGTLLNRLWSQVFRIVARIPQPSVMIFG